MRFITSIALALASLVLASGVRAQTVNVSSDITTSTTWTANNTYNLTTQIYVTNGATLCIEAGTVIASASSANGAGSLAVTRGSKIECKGEQLNPVIFTSMADVATWDADASHPTGGDPTTGTLRTAANEWGNLTIMGRGFISENNPGAGLPANSLTCSASNVAVMEGLTAGFPGDTRLLYGGGDDDDCSGTISYTSFRYGGRVIGLANELNGLSLGGVGRGTDIHHVEILNNVDDGIEIWGGTVNLSHFSIWNVGDDSFDVDQGWRGKAQFGLIVQGFSVDAPQGSGVGDNCCEIDGAEDSFYQPVTTTTLKNLTIIGQPVDGDGATAWRDGARVQYHSCIMMDCGEQIIRPDGTDGLSGYGAMGTLTFEQTFTTPYTATSTVNPCPNPGALYTAQSSGNLSEICDTIFFRNLNPSAYTESDARGQTNSGGGSQPNGNLILPFVPSSPDTNSPVVNSTRGPLVTVGGRSIFPVTFLDPRPQGEACTGTKFTAGDDFFRAAGYRGAFAPGENWLAGWTGTDAFGLTPDYEGWNFEFDKGNVGSGGVPVLSGTGVGDGVDTFAVQLTNAAPSAPTTIFIGNTLLNIDLAGIGLAGCFFTQPFVDAPIPVGVDGKSAVINGSLDVSQIGGSLYLQTLSVDPAGADNALGLVFSNGLELQSI